MGFKNTALNLLFNPIGIFEETKKAFSGGGGSSNSVSQPQAPLPLPKPPDTAAVADQANKTIQRKKAAVSQSIYTSPLGISGQADVARKTLTGQ